MADALRAARAALAGRRAWLVGGAVRDRAARARTADLDVVVAGDPATAARAVARAAGRAACFALSEEFGAWRVVARDWLLAGRRRAAARRLAGGRPGAARLHRQRDRRAARRRRADRSARRPRDLRARRLRMAGAAALSPTTRCACCAWCASPSSSAWRPTSRRCAQRARARRGSRGARAERVFAELRRIVARRGALRGLELMGELGATAVVLPELDALRGRRAEPLPPRRRLRAHAGGARRARSRSTRAAARTAGAEAPRAGDWPTSRAALAQRAASPRCWASRSPTG